MQNRKYLVGGLLLIIVVLLGWWIFANKLSNPASENAENAVPSESAQDVVLDFYIAWLAAAASTTATPSAAELLASPVLSDGVRAYVATQTDSTVESVLCQTVLPERLRVQAVAEEERSAEYQIFARGDNLVAGEYALVAVSVVDGAWQIGTIGCYSGESAPEREFTFEQSGQLLKSVPAPLDANNWHLVFRENNQPRIVPMFFGSATTCVSPQGSEAICVPEQLAEAAGATVIGNMTEAGVDVVRLELR